MQIKPLQNWVVIEKDVLEEISAGGIIIPGSAERRQEKGTVIAVGPGRFVEEETSRKSAKKKEKNKEKKFVKTSLNPGDCIMYEQYATRDIEVDGVSYLIVREEDVLGVLV